VAAWWRGGTETQMQTQTLATGSRGASWTSNTPHAVNGQRCRSLALFQGWLHLRDRGIDFWRYVMAPSLQHLGKTKHACRPLSHAPNQGPRSSSSTALHSCCSSHNCLGSARQSSTHGAAQRSSKRAVTSQHIASHPCKHAAPAPITAPTDDRPLSRSTSN
jgi:hypothetical protein